MTQAPLIERAREAFAEYSGRGRWIIDELIFALNVANGEVARLQASHAQLLEAAKHVLPLVVAKDFTSGRDYLTRLRSAITIAEEIAP